MATMQLKHGADRESDPGTRMIRVGVGVMGHPARAAAVVALSARVIGQGGDLRSISLDWGDGCWATARECWRRVACADVSHALVLQDDVEICRDLPRAAAAVAAARPDAPIMLFAPWCYTYEAERLGFAWVEVQHFAFSQALMLPTRMALDAIDWIDAHCGQTERGAGSDSRLERYFTAHAIRVFTAVPSLVQHRALEVPSLISAPDLDDARMSRCFVGADASGLDFDWSDLRSIPG